MNWLLGLGSLAGVLALGGIARLLRLGRDEPLTAEEIAERLQFDYPPFTIDRLVISRDGRMALARASDGRLAAAKAHGAHPATRLLSSPMITAEGEIKLVDTGDRWFGPLRLQLDEAQRDTLRAML